ncbi:HpcH/HpaI aldolase/citrate lyase family protein [Paracoccus sp. SCSIO 75233]|uniref:HpcH/HpaI aldolase family protein n=1 Tax=Paracoccus sp. SCSIO 75233 TaxID=3017782 RepID=UPI0022F125C1|nr:aldolase/citrate lyase family protein [Paracoccus sp. SCSIO 75233]WBU51895.1 aldolase/citrate lyase family protein [Paracoccus sp. SCSIO 75233]
MPFPAVHAGFSSSLMKSKTHLTAFCQFPDPNVTEALARTKLDSVLLDMQHGMFDEAAVIACVAAAALEGKPVFVRVPVGCGGLVSRVLDFGAVGVVCPMVNTVTDAEKLVAYTKFPPLGARSWGPRRAIPLSGLSGPEYLKQANELNLSIAMIETQQALDNLEAILSVPGIDGVFVGPVDLSVSLSDGSSLSSPKVDAALTRVAERAGAAGKLSGIFAASTEHAIDYAAKGYRFIGLMQDAMFLQKAADDAVTRVRERTE